MHKFKGISLIETLISLTIVGVALVALLPVMTIRQSAFSVSTGKEYFTEVPATPFTPAHYKTDNQRVFIGDFAINKATQNLNVDTFEFAYKDIPTLNATKRLHYNTNRIQVIDNGLNISSGTRAEFTMQYPANVFFNNNNVIINNTTDINTLTALKFAPNLTNITSYPKKDYTSSANPTQSLNFIPSLEGGSNFYTISIGDNEYFSYNVNNIEGTSTRQIGIGQNALTGYIAHRDFIGIFNEDNNTKLLYSAIPANFLLAIGRVTAGGTNTWQDYRSFVISYDDNNTPLINDDNTFNFNANVVAPNLTTTNVILTSDKRLKTILGEYKKSLKELLKIKPVAFTYKNDDKQDKHIGVIAQDIRKTFPEAVKVGKDNYLLVSIEPMFYALLNSIKELDKKNKNLKEQNDELEKKIQKLRKIAGGKHE